MLDAFKDNLITECQHKCWNDEGAWGHLSPSCDFFEPLPPPPHLHPHQSGCLSWGTPPLKIEVLPN